MAATITLVGEDDTIVISGPGADQMTLDVDPKGIYSTGFTLRTEQGAREIGGRVTGNTVPIREITAPIDLWDVYDEDGERIPVSAAKWRLQRLFGSPPRNLKKVVWRHEAFGETRELVTRLAKEIEFTTDDGYDETLDGDHIHAVLSLVCINPMYEGAEEVAEWVNPGNFSVYLAALGGTFTLGYGPVGAAALTGPIMHDANAATVQAALEALPTIGPGNVTVTADPGLVGRWNVLTSASKPGILTVDGTSLTPLSLTITMGTLEFTIDIDGESTQPISIFSSASTIREALEQLSNIGTGGVTVSATLFGFTLGFGTGPLQGFLVALFRGQSTAGIHIARVVNNPNTGWFDVWNPTDQPLWLEWIIDPCDEASFPDFSHGQERMMKRAPGADATRMVVTPELVAILHVRVDRQIRTYRSADNSNITPLFDGVEPVYPVPPYTGTEDDPIIYPVTINGPAGAKITLIQRRFWSAESGLHAPEVGP